MNTEQLFIKQVANIIDGADYPVIMVGNGIIRANACDSLIAFAEVLNIPIAQTFTAKGCLALSHPLFRGSVGLQADDYIACGFNHADVVICIGFDMGEYHPKLWHPDKDKKLIHIDSISAEVDEHYLLEAEVLGDIESSLADITQYTYVVHYNAK